MHDRNRRFPSRPGLVARASANACWSFFMKTLWIAAAAALAFGGQCPCRRPKDAMNKAGWPAAKKKSWSARPSGHCRFQIQRSRRTPWPNSARRCARAAKWGLRPVPMSPNGPGQDQRCGPQGRGSIHPQVLRRTPGADLPGSAAHGVACWSVARPAACCAAMACCSTPCRISALQGLALAPWFSGTPVALIDATGVDAPAPSGNPRFTRA